MSQIWCWQPTVGIEESESESDSEDDDDDDDEADEEQEEVEAENESEEEEEDDDEEDEEESGRPTFYKNCSQSILGTKFYGRHETAEQWIHT